MSLPRDITLEFIKRLNSSELTFGQMLDIAVNLTTDVAVAANADISEVLINVKIAYDVKKRETMS